MVNQARVASRIEDPVDISAISGQRNVPDVLYTQSSCACTWCGAHPVPEQKDRQEPKARQAPKDRQEPKARQSPKARQEPKARQAPKARQEPKAREEAKAREAPKAREAEQSDSCAGEYTVRSFLDARYMFSENVDLNTAILPCPGAPLTKHSSLTYALHVLIDWEGVDSEGKPYKPTWEVADNTTVTGEAWRSFVSKKRRLSGNKNWSVADIPFKRNARPGKHMAH